ncbi:MAG: hypothetical protein ABI332_00055, partial [Polyangiaceae bacterium]
MKVRAFCTLLLLICSCKGGSSDAPNTSASPQASAVPAPLATLPTTTSSGAVPTAGDAGPPPVPMRGDQ